MLKSTINEWVTSFLRKKRLPRLWNLYHKTGTIPQRSQRVRTNSGSYLRSYVWGPRRGTKVYQLQHGQHLILRNTMSTTTILSSGTIQTNNLISEGLLVLRRYQNPNHIENDTTELFSCHVGTFSL